MRLRYYRCYSCKNDTGAFGKDFEVRTEDSAPLVKLPDNTQGLAVTCPTCQLSNLDPRHGGNVVSVVCVHFEPPRTKDTHGREGCGHIACDTGVRVQAHRPKGQELYASGEPLAVNCPKCKESKAYKEMTLGGIHPSFDVPLPADEKGGPLVPELHDYQKPADKTQPPAEPLKAKK